MYTKTQIQRLRKPATIINIAYFTTLLIGGLVLSSIYFYSESHASSADYTIRVCERNFIGTEYKPYLAKKCDLIWKHLSYQILPTNE